MKNFLKLCVLTLCMFTLTSVYSTQSQVQGQSVCKNGAVNQVIHLLQAMKLCHCKVNIAGDGESLYYPDFNTMTLLVYVQPTNNSNCFNNDSDLSCIRSALLQNNCNFAAT